MFKSALLVLIGIGILIPSSLAWADGEKKDSPLAMYVKQTTKFSGDLRLRFDTQRRDEGPGQKDIDRRRWRYRLRFGLAAKLQDNVKVGIRLASGSGFQNTTNQSFDGHARGKDIFIDRAYASWAPTDQLTITGGKHKNPFFTSPLVWDPDVNLEGASFNLSHDFDEIEFFGNATLFVVEELDLKQESNADPVMGGYQGGVVFKPADDVSVKLAATYYNFWSLDRYTSDGIDDKAKFIGYNQTHGQQMIFDADDQLINEFNCLELGAKIKLKDVAPMPVGLFGYYLVNKDADIQELRRNGVANTDSDPADLDAYGDDDRDTGYQVGFEMGTKKEKKDFYIQYFYQVLEDYAFPAVFVDSDFHGGGTNNRGHRFKTNYYVANNVYFQGVFYVTERDDKSKDGKKDESRAQLDVVFKF